MKRIIIMLALAALTVVAMSFSAALAFAAPSPCTAGEPGCTSKKQTTTNSPSQGGGGGAEPFNLTTEKSGKGNGTQPLSNPHTVVSDPVCTNHSGNHTFSDTSKCTR